MGEEQVPEEIFEVHKDKDLGTGRSNSFFERLFGANSSSSPSSYGGFPLSPLHLFAVICLLLLALLLVCKLVCRRKRSVWPLFSRPIQALLRVAVPAAGNGPNANSILPVSSGKPGNSGGGSVGSAPGTVGGGGGGGDREGFMRDLDRGLTSSTFDVHGSNIMTGDNRAGLDRDATIQIENIMRSQGIGFDRARLAYSQREMRKMGIDPRTGLSRDPKAFSFGR
eukprot:Nk52_evm30s211 gene=Nk52_evmTU30s211